MDINNVFVSCSNHGWSIEEYLGAVPAGLVGEIHLAGHSIQELEGQPLRIDDHGSTVCPEAWELYRHYIDANGTAPTLIEWDSNIPQFVELCG
ncbi:MAG: DUF692 domain-containing protein [Candidatus Thiodiazotropha sp. (ex Ustalcina ferruginea)]|nr:DUF692 domain-containing protein [Candidatus Thiodiazotropha sp. (ex Ustalcina ferruginea)]